jgi:hypothetical protein
LRVPADWPRPIGKDGGMTQPARPTQRGAYLVGSLLMVVGLVLAAYSVGTTIGSLVGAAIDSDTGPVFHAPGSTITHLQRGSYLLMQRTGVIDSYGDRIDLTPVTISPEEVTVGRAPAAGSTPLAVFPSSASHHDRNGISFTAAVSFTAPQAGAYQILVEDPRGGSYLLVRDLGSVFHSTAGRLRATALGGLLFLAGLVTVIAGIARSRPTRPVTSQPYWDGYRWRR